MANPSVKDSNDFYRYLTKFGMYRPSGRALDLVTKLKEQEAWKKIEKYYTVYRKKWGGPDVDIYIFPIDISNRYFMRSLKGRSGLAFQNKLFLFLSPETDEKNWESLIVHEYHHASRMTKYQKSSDNYTLLDSIVFEGLAEHAVLKYCGKEYAASWTEAYQPSTLKHYWKQSYAPHLDVKRDDAAHDKLLYGRKGIPNMMGYAMGYELIKGCELALTMQDSLSISSKALLKGNSFID